MTTTAFRNTSLTTNDTIDLRVPADPAYLAVIRTATAGLAARLDLTLDEIEDLRIAVDEACMLLLDRKVHPGRSVHASFGITEQTLDVHLSGPSTPLPARSTHAWSVLATLVSDLETGSDENGSWITLTHRPASTS